MALTNTKRVVQVEWEDSACTRGWNVRQDYESFSISSIGYLVAKDKKGIVVSTSVSETGNVDNQLHIPKSAIRKFKYLRIK